VSVYGLIGLASLAAGLYTGYTGIKRSVQTNQQPNQEESNEEETQSNQQPPQSTQYSIGLSILGVLATLGGSYLMGADSMASYI